MTVVRRQLWPTKWCQVEPAPLSLGLHYYAIYDYAFGQITQRGEAGRSGIAHANLFLRPNGLFRSFIIKASTLEVGFIDFQSGEVGSDGMLQDVVLWGDDSPDTDGDGLHDLGEQIMGDGSEGCRFRRRRNEGRCGGPSRSGSSLGVGGSHWSHCGS